MSIVSMSGFGRWGRAGNQFFQYAFLTGYAEKYNLDLQIPPWVGNSLFGTRDSVVSSSMRPWKEPGSGLEHPTPPVSNELIDRDFHGYAQYHTSYFADDRRRIRDLFQPVASVRERMAPAEAKLTAGGEMTIGIHVRRGDYGRNIFPLVPLAWYRKWLRHHIPRIGGYKLFVATEDPSVVPAFAEWAPETVETLGMSLSAEPMENCTYLDRDLVTHDTRAMDWYPDFHLLSQCDIVLGGSSTFSFFAAMLNPNRIQYWRASLEAEQFVLTDPWDAYPILREDCRDYPHLEGITSAPGNKYW